MRQVSMRRVTCRSSKAQPKPEVQTEEHENQFNVLEEVGSEERTQFGTIFPAGV